MTNLGKNCMAFFFCFFVAALAQSPTDVVEVCDSVWGAFLKKEGDKMSVC